MDGVNPVIQVTNVPGLFAVLTQEAAEQITRGYMKLYWRQNMLWVETATRNRRLAQSYDPEVRLVFFAVDQAGRLVAEGP